MLKEREIMSNTIHYMFSEVSKAFSPFVNKVFPSFVIEMTKEVKIFFKNRWFPPFIFL